MDMQDKQIITLTEAAAERVRRLMADADSPILGLRVSLSTQGCSGMSYVVDYAQEQQPFEEVIEDKGAKLFIDPAATMFLIGSEMDYEDGQFRAGFTFKNPNEQGRCGCGESFHV